MKYYNLINIVEGLKKQDKKEFINSEISKIKELLTKPNNKETNDNLILEFENIKEKSKKDKDLIKVKEIEINKIKNILKNN